MNISDTILEAIKSVEAKVDRLANEMAQGQSFSSTLRSTTDSSCHFEEPAKDADAMSAIEDHLATSANRSATVGSIKLILTFITLAGSLASVCCSKFIDMHPCLLRWLSKRFGQTQYIACMKSVSLACSVWGRQFRISEDVKSIHAFWHMRIAFFLQQSVCSHWSKLVHTCKLINQNGLLGCIVSTRLPNRHVHACTNALLYSVSSQYIYMLNEMILKEFLL